MKILITYASGPSVSQAFKLSIEALFKSLHGIVPACTIERAPRWGSEARRRAVLTADIMVAILDHFEPEVLADIEMRVAEEKLLLAFACDPSTVDGRYTKVAGGITRYEDMDSVHDTVATQAHGMSMGPAEREPDAAVSE